MDRRTFLGTVGAVVVAVTTIRQARADGLRPDTQLTVSEWADRYRQLPKKSSAEPGPWRTERTPYLREIMDCFSSASLVEEVIFMKGSQVGGTEAILNAIGYAIDQSPGPAIIVQPTVELAKRFSRQRLDPLVTDTPRLAERVSPAKSRDSGNTILSKDFPGGQLIITGANSAVGLRSMPAQYALMDEIDGWPVDVDEEGSPIELVEARQRTFARRKRIKVSTPTIAGRSAIETAYEQSDQRRYYVPCPHCGEMQPLEFGRLAWTKFDRPPKLAVYECRACDGPIQDHQKTEMLAAGEWRSEQPAHDQDGKIRGYHLSALYSPVGWLSWGEIAQKFVRGHKNPEKHRAFVNTILGEVWTSKGEAPDWDMLQRRREPYAIGTVPGHALFLTAGCDVQKDRIVYEVVGWGRQKRSWSVDYGEFPGDVADIEKGSWAQVDALLNRMYPHEAGVEMPIRMLAVDSGAFTQTVYSWGRKYPLARVAAVKGHDHGGVLVGSPSPVEVTINGKKSKRGYRVWPVCSSMAKSELYGWLRLEIGEDGTEPGGFCHFPEYGDEYFKQLTSEQLVPHKTRKGYIRLEWEQIPGRQNHVLDARVYARAAAALMGLDRLNESDWAGREKTVWGEWRPEPTTVASVTPAPIAPKPPPAPRKPSWIPPRRTGSWLKGR